MLFLFGFVLIPFNCKLTVEKGGEEITSGRSDVPVTIHYERSAGGGIQSFQADVEVYSSNDRIAGSQRLVQKYRLSKSLINGKLYTRIDYDPAFAYEGKARSFLSDGKQMVLVDTVSGEVELRAPLNDAFSWDDMTVDSRSIMGRIDIERIRENCAKLSYDFTEDSESGYMVMNAPSSVLSKIPDESFIPKTFKLFFDTTEEVYAGSEMVHVEEDGTIVTTAVQPVYQEAEGELVQVGEVTTRKFDFPYTIDVSGSTLPVIESEEDIPVITQAELDAISGDGQYVSKVTEVLLGDPSNPDYMDTIVSVYDGIQVNTVDDELFRILF